MTIARSLTDTFAGIRPADVAPFIAAQLVGGALRPLLTRVALAGCAAARRSRS